MRRRTSLSSSAGSASSRTVAATSWISVPSDARTPIVVTGAELLAAATAARSAGTTRSATDSPTTGRSGSATGPSSDSGARPHHSSGSAPGTPASASRASSAAASVRSAWSRLRVAHDRPQFGDEPRQVQTPAGCGERPRRRRPDRARRGSATAARPRRSPRSRPAGAGPGSPPRRTVAAPRRAAPRRRHARRHPGRPATSTSRSDAEQRAAPAQVRPAALLHARDAHDVPLQALARVRGEDAGPRRCAASAVAQRVDRDLLIVQVLGRSSTADAPGSRSVKRAARRTGRRPRRDRGRPPRPTGPPAWLAAAHREASPVASHIAHSTSSALAWSATAARPASSTRATRSTGMPDCAASISGAGRVDARA